MAETESASHGFLRHARLIAALTFLSRIVGLIRETLAARYFGAGAVWSAFLYAFTIPNLFRKLLGEGALSAAFIPLYEQAVRAERAGESPPGSANKFAAASVNLLLLILTSITVVGEAILLAVIFFAEMRPETLLAVQLTAVMLPYVMLVCAAAFLGGVLQVHRRFAAPAATSVVLNLCLIVALVGVATRFKLDSDEGRVQAVWWMAAAVLVAGVAQILVLVPSLRTVGFRLHLAEKLWSPAVKKVLRLSIPVAVGASVLQIGVVLDKQIALMLSASEGVTHFTLLGRELVYPMADGALARLNWAQFMYQFPLGVFAIAIATAIFPDLAGDALDVDRAKFRAVLRRGIESSLLIGLPASAGMMLVAEPAIRVLFEHGRFTAADTILTARSTAYYSAAIWAFSVLQVVNRGFYSIHDTRTPLVWIVINLLINFAVELPLLWTPLAESAMAVGTLVSFFVQAIAMTVLLARRVEMPLRPVLWPIVRMLVATAAMTAVCLIVDQIPYFDQPGRFVAAVRLVTLAAFGAGVYFAVGSSLGLPVAKLLRQR